MEPVDDKAARRWTTPRYLLRALLGHLILLKIRPYKETAYRYLIFNEKTEAVVRWIRSANPARRCRRISGLIFPDGYYLGTGELKLFGSAPGDHTLER